MDFFRENKKEIIKLLCYIAIVLAVIFVINKFFFSIVRVNGSSMEPALQDNDIIIVDKTIETDELERFDIVAFKYVYDNKDIYLKRVIGMPGETIEIIDNRIYIDGEELVEFYGAFSDLNNSPDMVVYYGDYPETRLGADEYFVIGDNRYVSDDSRNFGPVTKDLIVGKATFRIWNINGIGSLEYQ